MLQITGLNFKSVVGLATDKPLSDTSLPCSPVTLNVAPSTTVNIPNPAGGGALGAFAISGDISTSFAVINSKGNPNTGGFFDLGVEPGASPQNPGNTPAITPPVPFDPAKAYVVLTGLSATGNIAGTFTYGPGSAGVNAAGALSLSSCTAFSPATSAWTAIQQAASGFKTIFDVQDLARLSPDETISCEVQTDLGLSVQVTASSLGTAAADAAAEVLNATGAIKIDLSLAPSVGVCADIADGYQVFVQRPVPGATKFSVMKSKTVSAGVTGSAGLNVTVTPGPAVTAVVNSAFASASGLAAGDLQAILAATGFSQLSGDLPSKVRAAMQKLGAADPSVDLVAALKSKLSALEASLLEKVQATFTAQFTYCWKRTSSDTSLAEFTVPDGVLQKYHTDILKLDLAGVMANGPSDGVVFTRILGQKIQELDIGYGFSFGVDSYVFLQGRDTSVSKWVELDTRGQDLKTQSQISFLGKTAYTYTWLNAPDTNYVELDASMAGYSESAAASDFQVGISLAFSWKNKKFSDILPDVSDCAATLAASADQDVTKVYNALVAAGVPPGGTGDATVSMVVNNETLRLLLPSLADDDYTGKILPVALARALFCPDMARVFPERCDVQRRSQVYAQICEDFLKTDPGTWTPTIMKNLCESVLRNLPISPKVSLDLINEEADPLNQDPWIVQSTFDMAPPADLQSAVGRGGAVQGAFQELLEQTMDFRTLFPDCATRLGTLGSTPYGTRVLACMFLLAADAGGVARLRIKRTAEVKWTDQAGDHSVVITQGVS
jgi:hypothetical protein